MTEPTPTPEKTPGLRPPQERQWMILTMAGGAVLVLAAIAIIVVLALRATGRPSDVTPTPTEAMEPTATAPTSPVPTTACDTIISGGDIEVSIALPISLTLRDTTFPVQPMVPASQAWSYPPDRSGTAVWVCGTVVNYVIGLEPTPENETLVTALTPGDEIRLQLASGAILPFRFAGRAEVAPGDEAALAQQQPRLTLVLGRNDTWQTATADYVAEAESVEPPLSEASAQLGQPVQVGDVRLTVNRGYAQRTGDLPSGTMYYLVEFSVANGGDTPLSADRFSMKLRDGMGNTYLVSPAGSEAGESGPLSGEIAPGSSVQGSAGYLVPDPLPAGSLIWTFSPSAGSEARAGVSIPYQGEAGGEPSVTRADVTINDAFTDGDTLILEGEVTNRGTGPLTVEQADISLSSSAGLGDFIMAAPPLPWTVEPGEAQVIELQYQRPDASTVLLELLGYSFEIGGLQ